MAISPIALTSSSLAPTSEVRRVAQPLVGPSFAELHAAANEGKLFVLAHAARDLERRLGRQAPSTTPRQSPAGSIAPLDVASGLRELLGDRASEVPAVYEVEDAPFDDHAARELLDQVARGIRKTPKEPIEIVVGTTVSAVNGVLVATPTRSPAIGTRLRIDERGDIRVSEADGYTLAWLDEIALGDVANMAARTVAMGVLLLRRASFTDRVPIAQCRLLARALVDLDPDARPTVDALGDMDDPAPRALFCALAALGLAEHATPSAAVLRAVTSAALLQPFLDAYESVADASAELGERAYADPTFSAEIVIAHEALRLRHGNVVATTSLQARLVALACEDTRGSVMEELELDESDLEEIEVDVELNDEPGARASIELPSCDADGQTTLSHAPVARILAMAHDRLLDGTLLLREPNGLRHAIVIRMGVPFRVRTHAPVKPLGARLVDVGALSLEELVVELARAAFFQVPLGAQVLADHLAPPEVIEAALVEQHLDRIREIALLPQETEVTLWLDHDILASIDASPAIDCDPCEAIAVATLSPAA